MSQQSMPQQSMGVVQCTLVSRELDQPFPTTLASSVNEVCCAQYLSSVTVCLEYGFNLSSALQYTAGIIAVRCHIYIKEPPVLQEAL